MDNGIQPLAFFDSDKSKHGMSEEGVPITGIDIALAQNTPVIICSMWAREIAQSLQDNNVHFFYDFSPLMVSYEPGKKNHEMWIEHFDSNILRGASEKIDRLYETLQDSESKSTLEGVLRYRLTMNPLLQHIADYDQYIHPKIFPLETGDVIDCGAWEGDSALSVLQNSTKAAPIRVHAMEPNSDVYDCLSKMIKEKGLEETIIPHAAAVGDHDGITKFQIVPDVSMGGSISSNGDAIVDMVTIDTIAKGNTVVYIKMDIEGGEIDALHGAKETIVKQNPKLAISVYHQPNDPWDIFNIISNLCPAYKFYLGHHEQHLYETILYASL
jgi:FkbM family methyltransferase